MDRIKYPDKPDAWDRAFEEARTNGVSVIYGPTGEVLEDFSNWRFTMRRLYDEAGFTSFPFKDEIWDPY